MKTLFTTLCLTVLCFTARPQTNYGTVSGSPGTLMNVTPTTTALWRQVLQLENSADVLTQLGISVNGSTNFVFGFTNAVATNLPAGTAVSSGHTVYIGTNLHTGNIVSVITDTNLTLARITNSDGSITVAVTNSPENLIVNIVNNPGFYTNVILISNLLYNVQLTRPKISASTNVNIYDDLSFVPRFATTLTNQAGITFNPTATVAPTWGVSQTAGFVSFRINNATPTPVAFTQTNKIAWYNNVVPTMVTNGTISFTSWGPSGVTARYNEVCVY